MPNWCSNRMYFSGEPAQIAEIKRLASGAVTPFYRRATNEGIQLFLAGSAGLLQITENIRSEQCPGVTAAGRGAVSPENIAFTCWLTHLQNGVLLDEQNCLMLHELWLQSGTGQRRWEGLSLLSFCTACSIHGVQTRECGHTSRSPLDSLETAIGFHMRDWWQPTKANFFGHLKKPQIIAALNEAGLSGAARDAEKMKKGDAAEHAEHHMKDNRWVPGWMCAPHPQTDATERTDNLADAA